MICETLPCIRAQSPLSEQDVKPSSWRGQAGAQRLGSPLTQEFLPPGETHRISGFGSIDICTTSAHCGQNTAAYFICPNPLAHSFTISDFLARADSIDATHKALNKIWALLIFQLLLPSALQLSWIQKTGKCTFSEVLRHNLACEHHSLYSP